MTIENVINRSCINLHMKGRDKKEVIEEMAEMFDRAGVLVDKAGYIKAVYERESEGPTGIGDQVAIPHGKTAAVGKTAMAVGRLDKGIEWETLGELPHDLLVVVVLGLCCLLCFCCHMRKGLDTLLTVELLS